MEDKKRKHEDASTSDVKKTKVDAKSKGRKQTVSIALPGSIADNAQSRELRTYLAGQIARAAAVFSIDEVIVFDDKSTGKNTGGTRNKFNDGNVFMAKLLQYLETPQYLRRDLFPRHRDLQFAGLLNPVVAPHHLEKGEVSEYREGVVIPPRSAQNNQDSNEVKQSSHVNVGLERDVRLDRELPVGSRVTVRMSSSKNIKKKFKGKAVAPSAPREQTGIYWGYTVRMAANLSEVWTGCPFKGGYDHVIGTSENGDNCYDDHGYSLPKFEHLLIVFGGVAGLEQAVEDCEELDISPSKTRHLFDEYVNACPNQGSRTIRTEEAIFITLSLVRPFIQRRLAS